MFYYLVGVYVFDLQMFMFIFISSSYLYLYNMLIIKCLMVEFI